MIRMVLLWAVLGGSVIYAYDFDDCVGSANSYLRIVSLSRHDVSGPLQDDPLKCRESLDKMRVRVSKQKIHPACKAMDAKNLISILGEDEGYLPVKNSENAEGYLLRVSKEIIESLDEYCKSLARTKGPENSVNEMRLTHVIA